MVWKRAWVVGIKSGIGEEEDSRMSRTPDVFVETRKLLAGTGLCRPLVRPRAPGRSALDKAAPFQHCLPAPQDTAGSLLPAISISHSGWGWRELFWETPSLRQLASDLAEPEQKLRPRRS